MKRKTLIALFFLLPLTCFANQLHEFIKIGNYEPAKKMILEKPSLVNEKDPDNTFKSPLLVTAVGYEASPDFVKFLLDQGANPNDADETGLTPLISAAARNSVEVVRILLERGADKNKTVNVADTALSWALSNETYNNIDIVKLLVDNGLQVTPSDLDMMMFNLKRLDTEIEMAKTAKKDPKDFLERKAVLSSKYKYAVSVSNQK